VFSDPLAKRLVEGRGEAIVREMPDGEVVGWSIVLRTCIIDDYLPSRPRTSGWPVRRRAAGWIG